MMSEELDFEADAPITDNSKLLSETQCFPQVAIKTEPIDDDTACAGESNFVTSSDSGKVRSEPRTDESNPGDSETDAEKISGTKELEDASGCGKLVEEKKDDAEETELDTERAKTGEIQEEKSVVKVTDRDTGDAEIDSEKNNCDEGEVESDTGEILSDAEESTNNENKKEKEDLEDGELDEDIVVPNKAPEVVCRFFQRGTCIYGSQCRNAHVSNKVYNMFSPDPPPNFFKPFELPNFFRPPLFHPNMVPMLPEVETPWERGIKRAKILVDKSRRLSDDLELENDWERCLEEAKANIKKASMKRKSFDDGEKPYFEPKYSKQEKFREKSPFKKEQSPNRKYSKKIYSNYENESNYVSKDKPVDKESTHDPFKWVDPWQRSKSPKRRTRSMSFSVSPSQSPRYSRERSVSSSSSSSSIFEQIYRGKDEKKGPGKRSVSRSASPVSKRSKDFKSLVYGKKRSYSRSVSRSISRSPKTRRYSRSSSSGHSANLYTRKNTYDDKKPLDKTSRRVHSRNGKYPLKERTKDIPLSSGIKSSYNKTNRKFSSRSKSRSCSPLSSLSCTSISSLSDADQQSFSKTKEEKAKKINARMDNRSKEPFKTNKAYQEDRRSTSSTFHKRSDEYNAKTYQGFQEDKRSTFGTHHKRSGEYDTKTNQASQEDKRSTSDTSHKRPEDYDSKKPKKSSPERPKLSIPAFTIKKSKSSNDKTISLQSAFSNPSSKPTVAKKATDEKPSAESMELLRYHSLAKANNKANSSKPVSKPPEAKTTLPRDNSKSSDEMQLLKYHSVAQSNNSANSSSTKPPEKKADLPNDKSTNVSKSKTEEATSPKSISNIKIKSEPVEPNTSDTNVKKKVLSKRKMLLQQLQAIEEAIARKKQPAQ